MSQDRAPSRVGARAGTLAAAASGFGAALALLLSTYNVALQRQQIRAQVWPRVTIALDYSDDHFSVAFENRGVGPADVKSVRVLVDGEPTKSWLEAQSKLLRRTRFEMPGIAGVEGEVLSPGQIVRAWTVVDAADARALIGEEQRLSVEACFCSTLGDCWIAARRGMTKGTTRAVDDCPHDDTPFESIDEKELSGFVASTRARAADAGRDGD